MSELEITFTVNDSEGWIQLDILEERISDSVEQFRSYVLEVKDGYDKNQAMSDALALLAGEVKSLTDFLE